VTRIPALLLSLSIACGFAAGDAHAQKGRNAPKAKSVADVGQDGGPNLLSSAAVVYDPTTGQTLYAKNADNAAPIASITKLMTAMVVLDSGLPLDEAIVLTNDDIDTIKNSRSRLPIGSAFRRDDLIRLALVASDNRAAAALGRSYPGGLSAFVETMNAKARSLGLESARFVDSSGLAPGNVASPQDLARMVSAASQYEVIREYSTTPELHVTLPANGRRLGYMNTNALVRNPDWHIGVSKTGYISEAGKCLVMQAMIANQPVVIVLLDSWGKLSRLGDAARIKRWLEKSAALSATPLKRG
jgi:serine-type D-Ala-D-Ala endopeptidase (penicillin-binding protein 7)